MHTWPHAHPRGCARHAWTGPLVSGFGSRFPPPPLNHKRNALAGPHTRGVDCRVVRFVHYLARPGNVEGAQQLLVNNGVLVCALENGLCVVGRHTRLARLH